jgi:hypothetical protein
MASWRSLGKVTKEAILEAPEYHVPPLGAT